MQGVFCRCGLGLEFPILQWFILDQSLAGSVSNERPRLGVLHILALPEMRTAVSERASRRGGGRNWQSKGQSKGQAYG